MNTKTIFKALALAMLMPAMLLTTACSNEDDLANNAANTETVANKGYALPVTVNVTRQDAASTRATFDGSKLNFSEGDKLLVRGNDNSGGGAGSFAGLLDYDAVSGKFSGTIYTQNEYSSTADALFTAATANWVGATLFPSGYETYAFLSLEGSGYSTSYSMSYNKAIAATKAAAVEHFSLETAKTYSSGFALSPSNAILNFTITGLTDGAKAVVLKNGSKNMFSGSVTPTSGTAAFALGARLDDPVNLKNVTLTIGGTDIAIISTHYYLEAGKIYNITRSAAPAPAATSLSELKTAINGGTDCSSYIGWEVNSEGAIAESGVSGTKIGYVAYVSTSDVDAGVSGSRILVIASADAAATTLTWGSDGTYRHLEAVEDATDLKGYSNTNTLQGFGSEAHPAAYAAWNYSAAIPSGGASPAHWFMPTMKQWKNMRDAKGGTYSAMATAYGIDGHYWTSNEYFNGTDYSECNNYAWRFVTNSGFSSFRKLFDIKVRSIFAY